MIMVRHAAKLFEKQLTVHGTCCKIKLVLFLFSLRKKRRDYCFTYNYSARTKRPKKGLVDEDGGYRIFGGCLPADYADHSRKDFFKPRRRLLAQREIT